MTRSEHRWARLDDDRAFSLVEIMVASALALIAVIGMGGAMMVGMTSVGASRQRGAGVSVATERIERIQNLPYHQVALSSVPVHNPDPDHPDHGVSGDGTTYLADGVAEELVVDEDQGAVLHIENPVSGVEPTKFDVYQYVTWVEGTDRGYKRATVVVSWQKTLGGATARVSLSTFVGVGSIEHEVPVPTASPAPPEPSYPPEPQAPDPGDCADVPEGSITIVSGLGAETGFTNSTVVQVRLEAHDPCDPQWMTAQLSNDGVEFVHVGEMKDNDGEPSEVVSVTWMLPPGDGTKVVSARFRNAVGLSGVDEATIVLNQTAPTVPADLRTSSCDMSGTVRTVTMTWDVSQGANMSGYRVYRSVNSLPFSLVAGASTTWFTDSSSKTNQSTRYLVRSYDMAGNESDDSNILTYPKNSC